MGTPAIFSYFCFFLNAFHRIFGIINPLHVSGVCASISTNARNYICFNIFAFYLNLDYNFGKSKNKTWRNRNLENKTIYIGSCNGRENVVWNGKKIVCKLNKAICIQRFRVVKNSIENQMIFLVSNAKNSTLFR